MESALSSTPCPRCGDYALLHPSWTRTWCDACLARRDDIELDPPSLTSLLSGALRLSLQIGWLAPLLTFVLTLPPLLARPWLGPGTLAASGGEALYHSVVQLVAIATIVRLGWMRVIDPTRASFQSAFVHVLRRYPRVLLANVLSLVRTLLYMLLLIVPGIIRALDYALVVPIAVNEDVSARDALATSIARMRGQRVIFAASALLLRMAPVIVFYVVDPTHGWFARAGVHITHPAWLETIEYAVNSLLSIPAELLPLVLQLKLATHAEHRRG